MLSLTLASEYSFTLSSGRSVTIIVHGSKAHPIKGVEWDISIDGVHGSYSDLNQALDDSFTQITLIH